MPSAWLRRHLHPCEEGPSSAPYSSNAGLADLDAELEKALQQVLGAPHNRLAMLISPISRRISTVQLVGRSSAAFPAPIRSETDAVPTDDGLRLHNRQRLEVFGAKRYSPTKSGDNPAFEGQSLRKVPPLDVEVDDEGSGSQLPADPRPEQQDQHRPDQAVKLLSWG